MHIWIFSIQLYKSWLLSNIHNLIYIIYLWIIYITYTFQGFITNSFQKSCQNFVPKLEEQFCQQCHHPQEEALQRERLLAVRRPPGQGGPGGLVSAGSQQVSLPEWREERCDPHHPQHCGPPQLQDNISPHLSSEGESLKERHFAGEGLGVFTGMKEWGYLILSVTSIQI